MQMILKRSPKNHKKIPSNQKIFPRITRNTQDSLGMFRNLQESLRIFKNPHESLKISRNPRNCLESVDISRNHQGSPRKRNQGNYNPELSRRAFSPNVLVVQTRAVQLRVVQMERETAMLSSFEP